MQVKLRNSQTSFNSSPVHLYHHSNIFGFDRTVRVIVEFFFIFFKVLYYIIYRYRPGPDIAHRAGEDSGPSVGVWLCQPCADDFIEKVFLLIEMLLFMRARVP